jgi:hypothetical protein
MKVNLEKYQSGGPFVTVRPLFDSPTPNVATPIQNEDGSKKSSIVDDESDDLLKEGGLTSDYYALISNLSSLESQPFSFLDANNSGKAIRMMRGKINEMINNKEI